MRLARALGVPTDWIIDDEQGFPPPPSDADGVAQADNETLMLEVARRYRLEVLDFLQKIEETKAYNIPALIDQMRTNRPEKTSIPPEAINVGSLYFLYLQILGRWDVDTFAQYRHSQLPGAEIDPKLLTIKGIAEKFDSVAGKGGFKDIVSGFLARFSDKDVRELSEPQHRKHQLVASHLASNPSDLSATSGMSRRAKKN